MTKLEELTAQLEEAKLAEQRLGEVVNTLRDETKEGWIALLKPFMPVNTSINIQVIAESNCYIEIEVLDENDKRLFGTDICLHINKVYKTYNEGDGEKHKPDYELKLNTGTCGSFNKDDYGQVNKYKIMGNLVENFELIENTIVSDFKELRPLIHSYDKAHYDVEKLEGDIQAEKDRIELEAFKKSVDYNAVYKVACSSPWAFAKYNLDGYCYLKLEKITTNYEYFAVGSAKEVYDDATRDYKYAGEFAPIKSKRYPIGTFIRWLHEGNLAKAEAN